MNLRYIGDGLLPDTSHRADLEVADKTQTDQEMHGPDRSDSQEDQTEMHCKLMLHINVIFQHKTWREVYLYCCSCSSFSICDHKGNSASSSHQSLNNETALT